MQRPARVDPWLSAQGQHRHRSLSDTLRLATAAASRLGVTRLADVTGLDRIGIPVFQAIRPLARSLSVAQGKGLTPMAAMVSALLESSEFAVAEALPPPAEVGPLAARGRADIELWNGQPRGALAIRLLPSVRRGWLPARDLASGAAAVLPWDLVSLDFTGEAIPDVVPNSTGLATGNSPQEAEVGAVAELLERDLFAWWCRQPVTARLASELDLSSVDEILPMRLLRRVAAAGCRVRLWSIGQDWGIAAFRCVITEAASDAGLPPALGLGCHPDRVVALLRAVLEAVQVRVMLIAGARDDLTRDDYRDAAERTIATILEDFSIGPGSLPWEQVPHRSSREPRDQLETLLDAVARRTPLPVLAVTLCAPTEGLFTIRAIAPGLEDGDRVHETLAHDFPERAPRVTVAKREPKRIVLFVGPSLPPNLVPSWIEARPPAVCGDLARLLADPPKAVGLVDGCFEIAPTVWHKEILDLLAHGVPVIGGASLGALRAAELHTLGMTGVGHIFEAYRDGRVMRDDAVLLVHAPPELGSAPLTVSLVEAEDALSRVDMPAGERRILRRIVRTTSFRERRWDVCLAEFARRCGRSATVTAEALSSVASIKRADTLALIAALGRVRTDAPLPPFERPPLSCYYRALLAGLSAASPAAAPA